jgi:hypothetical protein
MLGMWLDQMVHEERPVIDGSKAVRDLGIRYTPIRQALKEEIESFRG